MKCGFIKRLLTLTGDYTRRLSYAETHLNTEKIHRKEIFKCETVFVT